MKSPKPKEWKLAINMELENLCRKSVWKVCRIPRKHKALGARWVFAKTSGPNNTMKYKADYVARGFAQKEGTNYAHTFALTAKFTLMQVLLTVAARKF